MPHDSADRGGSEAASSCGELAVLTPERVGCVRACSLGTGLQLGPAAFRMLQLGSCG
jgi:hypothetical protein